MLKVADHAFRTDTGRQRNANEDSYYVHGRVFAVADGMGGAQAGEVASRIAADSFESAARSGESGESYLRSIAEAANERIHSLAQDDKSHSGMGTTLTAALVEGDEVSFAHVGDSRAYVSRDGELRLLTSDHLWSRSCGARAGSPTSRPRIIRSGRSSPGRWAPRPRSTSTRSPSAPAPATCS